MKTYVPNLKFKENKFIIVSEKSDNDDENLDLSNENFEHIYLTKE